MHLHSLFQKLKKKFIILPIVLFLLLTALCSFLNLNNSDRQFQNIADEVFKNEMLANTLNMHYTLAYPENFGISEYTAILPGYSPEDLVSSEKVLTGYLQELSQIDSAKLSPDNAYTYRLLYSSLESSLEGVAFPFFSEPLSPSSGMHSQLPILLAEYTFRTEQDVKDYLTLIDQTDEYFASLATYQAEKKEAGLLQSDSSLQKVIRGCDSILSAKEIKDGTHFLQLTFKERIDTLLSQDILSKERADYYISLNDRLLSTVMLPAYNSLADSLFLLLSDNSTLPAGLSSFPLGREYYLHLLSQNTGSSLSVDEIKSLLYPTFEKEYETLHSLVTNNPAAATTWTQLQSGDEFPYDNSPDILSDLTARMNKDFPALSLNDTVSFPLPTIKNVSDSLAAYCAPAFYLTPPLDDTTTNIIYINPLTTNSGLDMYTTLAHEGYPGHLYQSVYHLNNMQLQDTHPIRQILWYGGYQEGWALYVEFLSYDYAIALANEQGRTDLASAYEIEKHNRSMQLCLYSLLDIAIHYDNTAYEEIHRILSSFGITDSETTRVIFDYIAEEPTNYLKYYLGYLEILSLKEKAKSLWQDEYSDFKFHQFLLDCGPSDFSTLEMTLS